MTTLKEAFGLKEDAGLRHSASARLGVSAMGGYNAPRALQSLPPIETPQGNQVGEPSTSPTTSYARFAQNTMTDDDIKDWMGDPDDPEDVGHTFDPPYNINRWRFFADYGNPDDQIYGEGNMLRKYISSILLELDLGEPMKNVIKTIVGDFQPKGTTDGYQMYKHIDFGTIVGVMKQGDRYQAYNFEEQFEVEGSSIEDVLTQALSSELGEQEGELSGDTANEISAVGGGAMGSPGQPSGQIRGHIGPMGSDNKSPYLKKKKLKND